MSPEEIRGWMLRTAEATADFYLENSCADGVPMWDTGAPNLHRLPANYLNKPSNPYNKFEPVDGSAAAIAAQGLIRLGNYLESVSRTTTRTKDEDDSSRNTQHATHYRQAGLTIAKTLFSSRISPQIRSTKVCCCTRFIIVPTAGITSRPAKACRMAKAQCGAIIICANWRC
jgi:hypothetical protein